MRILLECFATRNAAIYINESSLQKLYECVQIGRNGSSEEVMKANQEFHDLIVQASNNPVMIDIIDRIQSIIYLFRKTVVLYKRPFLIDEHEEIYRAILAHDGDRAEELMKNHLQADLEFCLHYINQ